MEAVKRSRPVREDRMTRWKSCVKKNWQLWLMLAPGVVLIFILNYIPMYGIQLGFREFDLTKGLTGGTFVGLKYFKQFLTSPMFSIVMVNTIRISAATLVFGFLAPILLALTINQIGNPKAKRMVQTCVYLPHFISIVVLCGMINVFLSPETGVLSNLIASLGYEGNILGGTGTFVPVYVISDIWQHCGWNSIIYLAALSNVDVQLYEAARMDGAGRLKIIRYVDIPAIMPTIVMLLILNMGGILGAGFDKTFLLQNTLNLPVSEVISTYTYKMGILGNQFSYSTAIGLFNTVINFMFLITANKIAKSVSENSLW